MTTTTITQIDKRLLTLADNWTRAPTQPVVTASARPPLPVHATSLEHKITPQQQPRINLELKVNQQVQDHFSDIISDDPEPTEVLPLEPELLPDMVKRALSLDHDDVAELVLQGEMGRIKSTSTEHGSIWYWDDRTKLWIEGGIDFLTDYIMQTTRRNIERFCLAQLDKFKRTGADKDQQKYIKLNNLYHKLGVLHYCRCVATLVKVRTYDKDFINRLDSMNDLLPIRNGLIVNLRDKHVRERVITDLFSFECPVDYDPNARSSAIDQFFNDITLGDNELKFFLQGLLGFCLTGHTHTQQMYILYGPEGANGKSTLMGIMEKIMGLFYHPADKEVFLKMNGNGNAGAASPALAALRGKRLVVFVESELGDKLNEARIKAITGGDKITARHLHKDYIEFFPRFKPFLLTNYKPECSTDPALWRRLVMVPFLCKFVDYDPRFPYERRKNPLFKDQILEDQNALNYFFYWLVEGAQRMYTGGLALPKAVTDATNEYKAEQNIYARFLIDSADVSTDPRSQWTVGASDLYNAFELWHIDEEGTKAPY